MDRMSEHKVHVAIVDDDDSFSRALSRLLRAAGLEARVYASAEAFLQDAGHPSIDCAVLDIHLGGMSGLQLRRLLTSQGRTIPVIFVTALDEPQIREQAQEVGCSAFLQKPVPGKLLVEAITNAVNQSPPSTPHPST